MDIKICSLLMMAACLVVAAPAKPQDCCPNILIATNGSCVNSSYSWMQQMCMQGYTNISSKDYLIDPKDNKLKRDGEINVGPRWYCVAQLEDEDIEVAYICNDLDINLRILTMIIFLLKLLVICLLYITAFIYGQLPYLQDKLNKAVMFTTITYTLHCFFVFTGRLALPKYTADLLIHLTKISTFNWITVFCFEMWRLSCDIKVKSNYLLYSLYIIYGWISPLVLYLGMQLLNYVSYVTDKLPYYCNSQRTGVETLLYYLFGPIFMTNTVSFALLINAVGAIKRRLKTTNGAVRKSRIAKLNMCFHLLFVLVVCWMTQVLVEVAEPEEEIITAMYEQYILCFGGIFIYFRLLYLRKRIREDLAKGVLGFLCLPAACANIPDSSAFEMSEQEECAMLNKEMSLLKNATSTDY